jgi:Domain of unknown function (DUF4129)
VTIAQIATGRLAFLYLLLAIFFGRAAATSAQSPVSSSPQTLTVEQYIAELDRCAAVLDDSTVSPTAVRELRASLPSSWTVTTEGGRYTIGTQWLSGDLAEIERNPGAHTPALTEARQKLQLYRADVQALANSIDSQRRLAQSRSRINAILSTREFRGQQGPTWFDVLRRRVSDWIDRQLERIFGPIRRKNIGNLIAWVAIGLAGALLLFWTLRFLMRPGHNAEMHLSGATPMGADWRRWLREAREAAGRGDFRAAVHAAYWTAIVRMEETKSLPEDRARTPRESLKLLGSDNSAYAPLAQLTRRFELVWYGYRAATAADWDDAAEQLETLGCPRS